MYELPDKSYLDELIGQEINLISVGPYDAQIAFEKGAIIQALHKLEGQISGERTLWFDGEWVSTKDILHVPKAVVVSITKESPLILKIQLSNDVALFMHTEISQYESINVTCPDGTLEVI